MDNLRQDISFILEFFGAEKCTVLEDRICAEGFSKKNFCENFCELFTGKEEGRQELGYLSSIEIINKEDNFTGNFCEFTGKETRNKGIYQLSMKITIFKNFCEF